MKTILVTGANGQLGRSIRLLADRSRDDRFLFTDVDTLDITDPAAVARIVREQQVGCIVNCAAYTNVEKAEDDEATAHHINATAVRILGEAARQSGAGMIHVSTDYVFDGFSYRPYQETDPVAPLSAYGRSKLAGETALREVCPEAVILRTSWLYSEFGANFVKTVLRLGKEREELRFIFDQIGTPTYAGDLAAAMLAVLAAGERNALVPGIYHFSNEGVCSWYDFAVKILQLAEVDCRLLPIETSEYPTKAIRPAYSVLNKKKIKETYSLTIPHWEESLRFCLKQLNE